MLIIVQQKCIDQILQLKHKKKGILNKLVHVPRIMREGTRSQYSQYSTLS